MSLAANRGKISEISKISLLYNPVMFTDDRLTIQLAVKKLLLIVARSNTKNKFSIQTNYYNY